LIILSIALDFKTVFPSQSLDAFLIWDATDCFFILYGLGFMKVDTLYMDFSSKIPYMAKNGSEKIKF